MEVVRVLLTEGSSLTAREVVTCFGPSGYHLEVLDPDPLCLARFSRWVRRVHRSPRVGADPLGYLRMLRELHEHGLPQYIECNPRTVEPGNAAASGVDIPDLQVRLTLGERLSSPPRVGRPGVLTHGTLALLLGTAARDEGRRALLAQLRDSAFHRRVYRHSAEQLTPIRRDPPSLGPLALVAAQLLLSPRRAAHIAASAVGSYSVTPAAIGQLRGTRSGGRGAAPR